MNNPFTSAQQHALVSLRRGLSDRQIVLIGAAALACQMDMKWRKTNDFDITVVADPTELDADLRRLQWHQDDQKEQRWSNVQGVLFDVLPATAANLADGKLVFPKSGHVLNLVGIDLALTHCIQVSVADNTPLDVATVPVIVLLKMGAWLDRPAERERDLEDLAHIINEYLGDDDLRRWDDELLDAGLPHESQSAFALGQDLVRIVAPKHLAVIQAFLSAVFDEKSAANAQFARCFGRHEPSRVLAERLGAFQLGLDRPRGWGKSGPSEDGTIVPDAAK